MSLDNNNQPLVSIVIPAYNQERFIGETIDYIISQTYENWELLIIDDRSTDKTQEIVEKAARSDTRIRLTIRDRDPKGAQTCRNTGIDNAKGDYIMILDSDDIIRPYCLEQRVEFMLKNPEIDFGVFHGASYNQKEEKVVNTNKWGVDPGGNVLPFFLEANYPFGVWNAMFKTTVAKETGFDEVLQIYQDFDFIVRVVLQGYTYKFDPDSEVDYLYRQGHSGAITSNFISEGKYESTKYLFSKTMSEIENLPDFLDLKDHFFSFFILQLKKVAFSGSKQQLKDFFGYVFSYYGSPYSSKLRWIKFFLHGPFFSSNKIRTKYVNFVFALIYSPKDITRRLFKK